MMARPHVSNSKFSLSLKMLSIPAFLADPLERFVLQLAPPLPRETDWSTSLNGSWYLSPAQHGLEFILWNALLIYACWYYVKKALATWFVSTI
jgi:hypothetical protein